MLNSVFTQKFVSRKGNAEMPGDAAFQSPLF